MFSIMSGCVLYDIYVMLWVGSGRQMALGAGLAQGVVLGHDTYHLFTRSDRLTKKKVYYSFPQGQVFKISYRVSKF